MNGWREAPAPAKLNLALVVGPLRADGKHEVVTLMERLSLADSVAVRRADVVRVTGFEGDTIVRAALDAVARLAGDGVGFEARIDKRIPVAGGLGGGSSDAATTLRLANELLAEPLPAARLEELAASLGADVPFFLGRGAQLATADGTTLEPVRLPLDYVVLLALPNGVSKTSTRGVYADFDARGAADGFEARRAALLRALRGVSRATDLAALPPNDLASSPFSDELRALGAFRADVTGAGPVIYGLFADADAAGVAAAALDGRAATWIARPG